MKKDAQIRFSDGGDGFKGKAPRATPAQLAAREDRATAIEANRVRRLDTRRKVVLGGAVMALARQSSDMAQMVDIVIKHMPERDRALFDGWKP